MLDTVAAYGSRPSAGPQPSGVLVLNEEPDLAIELTAEDRERATRLLRAPVLKLSTGPWQPAATEPGGFGMIVLEGLLLRSVTLGRAVSVELVGPGSVIRPDDLPLLQSLVTSSSSWEVVDPAIVAVLGRPATTVIGHWPELTVAFAERVLRRVRSQAQFMAAANFTRVEDRLLAAGWHLAGMWGRVSPEGIVIPFKLTHEMLAQLVGARRPSVTLAMGALKREGLILRRPDGHYVLLGDPPDWHKHVETTTVLDTA